MAKGQVIAGRYGDVKVREKADADIELGELLIAERDATKILLQVYDLCYGSQISDSNLELISGMQLEEHADLDFMDPELRNYTIAFLKNVIDIREGEAHTSKNLPAFFSEVREVTRDDLAFLDEPDTPLELGKIRSGTKELDVDVRLDGEDVLRHHMLITGTTGKGKSNLMRNLLWEMTSHDYCATLVLDPHDEYYGRTQTGLNDHENDVVYYTSQDVPPGGRTLSIDMDVLRPHHFSFMQLSRAQSEALYTYYKQHGKDWIPRILVGESAPGVKDVTSSVLRRKLSRVLDVTVTGESFRCDGVFKNDTGGQTVSTITDQLESGTTVVVDTSDFSGQVELLVGSLITSDLFSTYKYYKSNGELEDKPVVNVVLEEAPRVLGKEVLETGRNVFSTLAREGRKFNVGITAITQLPSLIPREILANMNTKVIMGTEMNTERQAIIESAAHDLSDDDRSIASLDVGEAIVSSNFSQFAIPLSIPYFDDVADEGDDADRAFEGVT